MVVMQDVIRFHELTIPRDYDGIAYVMQKVSGQFKERFRAVVRKVLSMFSRDAKGRIIKNTKLMVPHKWIEFFDPLHRRLKVMFPLFEIWQKNHQRQLSFWDFIKDLEADFSHPVNLAAQVHYFTKQQLFERQIEIQDGVLYCQGAVLEDGIYTAVLAPDNEIYAAIHKKGTIHHSSFCAGKSIFAAGDFTVVNGRLVKFSPSSGHYEPGTKENARFIDRLASYGITPANCKFVSFEEQYARAKERKLKKSLTLFS